MKRQTRDGRKTEVGVVREKRGVVKGDVVDGGTGTDLRERGETGDKHTVYEWYLSAVSWSVLHTVGPHVCSTHCSRTNYNSLTSDIFSLMSD